MTTLPQLMGRRVALRSTTTLRASVRASVAIGYWAPRLLIVDDAAAGGPVLHDRQHQDHREQNERERRAITVAVELEHLAEYVQAGQFRRIARPAARHDVHRIELFEGADNRNDQQEKCRRRKQWKGD